jgi:hypothetical protein
MMIISLYGGAGSGKSTAAKRLVERIGASRAARIPTDFYLASHPKTVLEYDWARLAADLSSPPGAYLLCPGYDFVHFQQLPDADRRGFFLRPLMITDAMRPCPRAVRAYFLDAPEALRRDRVAARDSVWGARCLDHWALYQATLALSVRERTPDGVIDAAQPAEAIVEAIWQDLSACGLLTDPL